MDIQLNEQPLMIADGTTLFALRERCEPAADLIIHNGYPAAEDRPLAEGDCVVLIRKGEIPSHQELEGLLAARHTPGVHERLRSASVGIAGAGGLGSTAAIALARSGIGRLVIADFDVVEPSNLNRQQYFIDQIGQAKVEALRENLLRINPYVEVAIFCGRLTPANVPDVFAEVDVLVEAFDAADQKAMLVESFLGARPGIPLVAASGMAGCGPANTVVTRRIGRNLYLVGDGETAARPGEGLMSPRVGVAAHHQANAVLQLLLGEIPGQEQRS